MSARLPTVTDLLDPLVEVDDRGVHFEDAFTSWRDHIRHGAAVAAALKARLDPDQPAACRGAAAEHAVLLGGAGRRGADGHRAGRAEPDPPGRGTGPRHRPRRLPSWCWPIRRPHTVPDVDYIDVDSPEWAAEVAAFEDAPVVAHDADPTDLFMLIYTSGTSGEPEGGERAATARSRSRASMMTRAVRTRARRHLLRVDAAVPFQCGDGRLGGRAGVRGLTRVAAQVLRVAVHSGRPPLRRHATPTMWASRCPTCSPHPSDRDDADNPLRAVYGNEGAPRTSSGSRSGSARW